MPPRTRTPARPDLPTTDDDPDLIPSPSPDPTQTSLLFGATPSPAPQPGEKDQPWTPEWSSDDAPASADDAPASPSAPRSTKARLRALTETTRQGVRTAGGFLHMQLTRPETPERDFGLYLPDDDDVEAIAAPLASLASRRVPEGVANPDVTDLLQLVLGVASYVAKQRGLVADLRARFGPPPSVPEDQTPADAELEPTP